MNLENNSVMAFLMGMAFVVVGSLAIQLLVTIYYKVKYMIHQRKYPSIVKYDFDKTCKDQHNWAVLTLALKEIPPGNYQTCTKCGVITGNSDYMLSDSTLVQVREKLELAAKREEAENEILDRVDEMARLSVDKYIATEFPDEFKSLAHLNKLRRLVQFSFDAQSDAAGKVSAEMQAKTLLDSVYGEWSKNRKGNA